MDKPTIGRIVHYVNLGDSQGLYPPECQAAIITGVNEDGTVALHIFYRTGDFYMQDVEFSEDTQQRRSWHWPERV
jgi:hypothetical protein